MNLCDDVSITHNAEFYNMFYKKKYILSVDVGKAKQEVFKKATLPVNGLFCFTDSRG